MDDRIRFLIASGLIAIALSGIVSLTVCYLVDGKIPAALAAMVGGVAGSLGTALVYKNGAK